MSRHRADYQHYLASRTWARLRRSALRRARGHCMVCRSPDGVEVHHNRYPHRWGTERRDDLVALCDGCHELFHSLRKLAGNGGGGPGGSRQDRAAARAPDLEAARV